MFHSRAAQTTIWSFMQWGEYIALRSRGLWLRPIGKSRASPGRVATLTGSMAGQHRGRSRRAHVELRRDPERKTVGVALRL